MLLTPTFIGSLLAGIACWLLFWYGISHVDSIPYLNQYLSRKMILEWIRNNPQLALILTELVNIGLHGVGSAAAVLFTFGGTLKGLLCDTKESHFANRWLQCIEHSSPLR